MWSSVNVQIINGSTKAAGSGSTAAELVFARNVLSDCRAIVPCFSALCRISYTSGCAFKKQLSLARVSRKRRGSLEFHYGFVKAAQLDQKVSTHAWQQVI